MYKKILFSLSLLFVVQSAIAQQADRIQRGQRGYTPPPKNFNYRTPISLKDPIKDTEKIMTICKEKFQLDDFESEILKGMTMRKIEGDNAILLNKDYDASMRQKELLASEKQYFLELTNTGIFSKEEVDIMKLIDFDSEAKEQKKSKKKKRKKGKTKA